jgi:phenylalanyl-tRNA synthetase beta chain
MRTSVTWLNDYLDPPASADEQAELLTRAGLPFDGREAEEGEVWQEIETTSNRGDCLSHLGLAREVAAMSGVGGTSSHRRVKPPLADPRADGPPVASVAALRNERVDLCPLYLGQVILGATVRPSPEWMARRLKAIGQIPRNNIVDCTNFVLFELGQPTHVFDLDALAERSIIVRLAGAGERLLPLGEGAAELELGPEDLVIADARRPVALAGIKGGAATAVREGTANLVLESATFNPLAVRRSSRRLRIASDSSFRFERGVHPAQVEAAARRLAALILETAGGTLCSGMLRAGAPLPPSRRLHMRVRRCRDLLGVELGVEQMLSSLDTLGFSPRVEGAEGSGLGSGVERIAIEVPPHRPDIEREIDVIEEVARMAGLDALPVAETISIRVAPPQPRVLARKALRDTLAGVGFVECVTHSLISEQAAERFITEGASALRVGDERARAEPVLRPSVLPSLLRVRRHNLDGGVSPLSLFEIASTFELRPEGHVERERLALLTDVEAAGVGSGLSSGLGSGLGLRPLRGVIERILRLLLGEGIDVELRGERGAADWLSPAARIVVRRGSGAAPATAALEVGWIGRVSTGALRAAGLDLPQHAAEVDLAELLDTFPPHPAAHALPAFPSIDRDLSAIVEESISWDRLRSALTDLALPLLESIEFVTAFRGKPIPAGRKSVTARLRFRSPQRTLRHEEVDAQMAAAVERVQRQLGAEIRS